MTIDGLRYLLSTVLLVLFLASTDLVVTLGEWEVGEGEVTFAMPGDRSLTLMTEARKHAISAAFAKPFDFTGKKLVLQYEFRIQERMMCGGAYIKLFPALFGDSVMSVEQRSAGENHFDPKRLNGDTPYVIMFGPDRCGDMSRVHFIYQYRNKMSGLVSEKHVFPIIPAAWLEDSPLTHLYRLELDTVSGDFAVSVDGLVTVNGTVNKDFHPPVQPLEQIPDPADSKPADWVDDADMDDPEDLKPANWDDIPAEIVDPESVKPLEWDDESDGEWEPSMIPNPDYNGPWTPRRIPNPAYKGVWSARLIPNPFYYVDEKPAELYVPIGGLGFELWSMQNHFLFNNIILTTDPAEADVFTELWKQKFMAESLIKEEIDYESSPPWYKRWFDNLIAFSEENPLTFASMLITLSLPFILYAIVNSPAKKKPANPQSPDNLMTSETKDTSPKTANTASTAPSSEKRKVKQD